MWYGAQAFTQSNQNHKILYSHQIKKDKNFIESEKIKVKLIKFMADFLDLGQAKWDMPVKNNSLYLAWREYSVVETRYIKQAIIESPDSSEAAIEFLLTRLGIPTQCTEQYLIEIIFQVLGWASIVKWLEERPDNPYIKREATITDIIAIWLNLEYALLLKYKWTFTIQVNLDQSCDSAINKILQPHITDMQLLKLLNRYTISLIWQRALEFNYQDKLVNQINLNTSNSSIACNDTPKAQLLFCIDTRSEGIRRKLEFVGNYKTYGFAGFFGVGFKLFDEHTDSCSFQCPAIVTPEITLTNKKAEQKPLTRILNSLFLILDKAKSSGFSPLILFDILGGWFSMALLAKTIIPKKANSLLKTRTDHTYSDNRIDIYESNQSFTPEILAEKANFVLSSIGLTKNFAPFIIISGHIAQSENNPFQSSLDCGACGGNGGIPNSIVFCQALNDQRVRSILKDKYNIIIPPSTFFVSSSHNTTTDEFNYYNLDSMNEAQLKSFNQISIDLAHAGLLLRQERMQDLAGTNDVHLRKSNWSELVPEMGLANNAAFIIGPRELTANINLERRTFLHSYAPELDESGEILSFILNAPVIVGHWINSQYYFSTTDMDIYGAGNKAIHNVVGNFGVMEGNFSDYKIGLPSQSIAYKNKFMHQPMRLLVVVYAKQETVDQILSNSPILNSLFCGRWAHLQVIEPNV